MIHNRNVSSDSSLSEEVASTLLKLQACRNACPFPKFNIHEVGNGMYHVHTKHGCIVASNADMCLHIKFFTLPLPTQNAPIMA